LKPDNKDGKSQGVTPSKSTKGNDNYPNLEEVKVADVII
jgi:hypothetical protein